MDSALRAMAAQQPAGADRHAGAPAPERDAASAVTTIFTADRAGSDALGRAREAAFLAELALHKGAGTPFAIGLFGAPGAGKSSFLGQVLEATERLAAAAASDRASPFCPTVVTVRVDAAVGRDPDALLQEAVLARLGHTHPALAADLRHSGDDPAEAARRADAALDAARRKLDAERQVQDDLTGREARLVDVVIDGPGSLVDVYARAKRSRLDRILRQFGFTAGDPVNAYKDLVREAAESNGVLARAGMTARALWAYKGQARLLVTAIILFALAWGIGVLRDDQAGWLGSVNALGGERAAPVAGWLGAHAGWLGPIENGLILVGVLLLLIDITRAARFVLPLARGVDLLQQEVEGRRKDLAGQLAHQTRRVDALVAEVETAAHAASEAERRAGKRPHTGGPAAGAAPAPIAADMTGAAAMFQTLAHAMASASGAAPSRIVVAIDRLDEVSGEAAGRIVATASRLLGEGCVALVAVQQSHLVAGFGETDPAQAAAQFARCIQLPYRVGAADGSDVARRSYALTLIEGGGERGPDLLSPPQAAQSALDTLWRPREAETVAALAPFAGDTPRAVKRFINLYRVARADPRLTDAAPPVFTALALALALDAHGFPDDLSALERASHGEAPGEATVLRKALTAAREASGQPVELGQAQRALDVAASYSGRTSVEV